MAEGQNALKGSVRLMITKMVLENFKSYAGVQEIGPFHKRFSSVVGPNGSGKSNVIDAMLFVFGKKAKQLRLNKVSELIHKSSNHPDLQYTTVSVHFQLIDDDETSDDDFTVVPGSEFVVTRTAYKDSSSKYFLNGKLKEYSAVRELLLSHGIDLDNNRFLILQGEVEQIAMMKAKGQTPHEDGLLEYLEDIIGSNRFLPQIEETTKVLDALNEKRVAGVNRMKIAERERDNLKDAKEEAQQYLDKERSIKMVNNTLFQAYVFTCAENVSGAQAKKENFDRLYEHEKERLVEVESRLSVIEKTYEATNAEYNRIHSEVERTTEEFAAFERRDVKLSEDLKYNKSQSKKLQAAVEKDVQKEAESLAESRSAEERVMGMKASITELKSAKAEEEARLDEIMVSLSSATAELREQLEQKQAGLVDAQRSVAELRTEKETVETSMQLTQSRAAAAAKQYQELSSKLASSQAEYATHNAKRQQSIALVDESRLAIGQLEAELAMHLKKESDIQVKLRSAVSDAEEAKASLQQSSGRSSTINAILNAAKKGGPLSKAGIRGRLGDLGTIAAEYDVAISTACGSLDFIVVDTSAGGQMCLNYLRDTNQGRASFIVLEQMDSHIKRMNASTSLSFPASRLFDLVTISHPDFRPAFYSALQDTLVVPDIDTATKIAFQGGKATYKVVTMDGNLIEASGAMSGGGSSKRSGGMRAKVASADDVTESQVKTLDASVAQLQADLAKCRKSIKETEDTIKELNKCSQEQSILAEKCAQVISRLSEESVELSSRIESLHSEIALTPDEKKQVTALQKRLDSIEGEMQRVAPGLKGLEAEVEGIQKQILDIGGPKLKRAQAKLDAISLELDNLNASVSKTEVEAVTAKKTATKANSAHTKASLELEKINSKITDLQKEKTEMENDALVVIQAVEQAKTLMAAQEQQLSSTQKEYDALKNEVKKISIVQVDQKDEIDKCVAIISENEKQKVAWERKLDELRVKYMEDARENLKFSVSVAPQRNAFHCEGSMEVDTAATEQIVELPVLNEEELERAKDNVPNLKKQVCLLEEESNKLKEKVNMSDLLSYIAKDADYRSRLEELETVTAERNLVRKAFEDLRRQRLEEFMAGFGVITLKLKEMYQMITLGGDAELELVDSLDPFSEGIVFSVRPPKKSWKNISNLSGGEKTLSSLALVFALHHYKPTPLYVMDEIDAALDFKNVSIVANYIKERTKNAQFVIISLRNNMFELADRLVGIYKTNDATKSVTVNPKMFDSAVAGGPPRVSSEPLSDCTNIAVSGGGEVVADKPAAQGSLRRTGRALW